jgi:hypothetical protein
MADRVGCNDAPAGGEARAALIVVTIEEAQA